MPLNSIIPETFGAWLSRPGFVQYTKSPYYIGGYEIIPNVGMDLDPEGLEWVRTFNLRRKDGLEFRLIHPEDMHVIIGEHPSEELVVRMYGAMVPYEGVCLQYYRQKIGRL